MSIWPFGSQMATNPLILLFLTKGHCGGCVNDVKHPNKEDAYASGHVGADELCGVPVAWSDSDEDVF